MTRQHYSIIARYPATPYTVVHRAYSDGGRADDYLKYVDYVCTPLTPLTVLALREARDLSALPSISAALCLDRPSLYSLSHAC